MPIRLPVLLQRRKSADAGVAKAQPRSAHAAKARRGHAPDPGTPTLIPPARIIRLAISRRFRLTVNEDGAEVIDVRERGTWTQQAAQALEEACGIVVGKKRGRIEADFPCPQGGFAVHDGAGGVLRRAF